MAQPLGNYVPGVKEGTVKVKLEDLDDEVTDSLDLLSSLPTADALDGVTVWNDSGVLKVSTSS